MVLLISYCLTFKYRGSAAVVSYCSLNIAFFDGENKNIRLPNYQLQLPVTENIFAMITSLQLKFCSLIAYGIFLLCNFALYNVILTLWSEIYFSASDTLGIAGQLCAIWQISSSFRGRNKVFLFDRSVKRTKMGRKSHCSSHIATKGFGGAVIPLFDPAFTGSFPLFSYKEVPDLQKINLFTFIWFNLLLRKYRHLLPSCSQHSWNPKQYKGYISAKLAFQELTRCHHIQTHYKI